MLARHGWSTLPSPPQRVTLSRQVVELSEPAAEEFLLSLVNTPTAISGDDWLVKKARRL